MELSKTEKNRMGILASRVKEGPGREVVPFRMVLGVKFNLLNLHDSLEVMDGFVQKRIPTQVSFSNAYTVTLCRRNKKLQGLINGSDLNLADGMSIVWGSRWLGVRLPGRVAGPDLTEALCARAAEKGYRIFLMGSSVENLVRLKSVLQLKFPAIKIVGTFSPSMCEEFSDDETRTMIDQFRDTHPDILFVGISCPKQEIWIAENIKRIGVPLILGVGAAFDFLSGRIPRAPVFLRNMGLEWLHRLYCEPRRLWKRYLLGNFVFLSLLIKEMVRIRLQRLFLR